jgi:hypothetical protein
MSALAVRAQAAEQTVLGSSLMVKDAGVPTKRKIVLKAKEDATDNTVVGDPIANGATLTITANGVSSSSETYTLPGGNSPSTVALALPRSSSSRSPTRIAGRERSGEKRGS